MLVSKDFEFHASHYLTEYHGKSERMHGHTYRLKVTVEGSVQSNGMVLDFSILKKVVEDRVLQKYDHRLLNEVVENPTTENVIMAIWQDLSPLNVHLETEAQNPELPEEIRRYSDSKDMKKDVNTDIRLVELQLWETSSSSVIYRGE